MQVIVYFESSGDFVVSDEIGARSHISRCPTYLLSHSMNLSVKVLRPHFPFNDPLDSGMEKQRRVFLNSELETQTQRHRIPPFPQDLHYLQLSMKMEQWWKQSDLLVKLKYIHVKVPHYTSNVLHSKSYKSKRTKVGYNQHNLIKSQSRSTHSTEKWPCECFFYYCH